MSKTLLLLLIASLPALASEEVGWKPTVLPLLNYSSDHGAGYGVRASLFRYAEGAIPYERALSAQAFFTTGGKWAHRLYLDLPQWRAGQRLEVELLWDQEDFANYYADLSEREVALLLGPADAPRRKLQTTFRHVYPKLLLMWLRALGAPWQVRAGLQAGHNQITPNTPAGSLLERLDPPGRRGGWLLLANAALRRDTRDDYNDSRRGMLQELLCEYGGSKGFRGGRLSAEHRHFLPLPAGLVLAQRLSLALTFGDLPFYEQPILGGDDTVRGLEEARERGEGRVLANAELRWPGFSPLPSLPVRGGLLCFFDAGQTFRRGRGPSLEGWRRGLGLGARGHWHSTIIRADLGRSAGGTGVYLKFSQVF
jgi:hypothetical protein